MFRFTRKPSSVIHSQYLAKITCLVQCEYRSPADIVNVNFNVFLINLRFYVVCISWKTRCLNVKDVHVYAT
jgi:hypothetical protein